MPEIRRGDGGSWHIAATPAGLYIRLHSAGEAIVMKPEVARDIAKAILEVTYDVHGE